MDPAPHDLLDALRRRFDARAAGWWRTAADRLEQVAFAADANLDDDVARGFAEATRSVPLDQGDLGIVRAAVTGKPAVSRTVDHPAESGSGLWLRRFGASRSIAVPVGDGWVVSLAMAGDLPDDESIASAIRNEAERWRVDD